MKICKTLSLANFLQYFQLTLNDAVSGSVSKVKFCLQLWRLMLFIQQTLSHMWTCTLKVTLAVRRGSLKRFNRDHITAFWMRRPVNVIRVLSNMYMFVQWRSHKGIFKHTACATIKRRANRHWNVYVYIFFFSPWLRGPYMLVSLIPPKTYCPTFNQCLVDRSLKKGPSLAYHSDILCLAGMNLVHMIYFW